MKKEKSLSINVKLNFKDYLKFNFTQYYKKSSTKLVSLIGIIILGIFISALYTNKSSINIIKNKMLLACFIFSIFLLLFYKPIIMFLNTKKIIKNTKAITDEYLYTFNSEGFTINSKTKSYATKWKDIVFVIEYKCCFAIYTGKIKSFLVPKRFFDGKTDDINDLRNIIKNNMPKNKLKVFKEN